MSLRRVASLQGLLVAAIAAAPMPASAVEAVGYATVQRAFLREEFEVTVTLAQTFLAENPTASETRRVWLWLVLSLDHLQRANEALKELDNLKRELRVADPLWPEVLYWEGDISRRAVQMVRAKLAFQRLLERYPQSTWAAQSRMGLGLIDLHQQAFQSAIGHFHEVALRRPGTQMASDALLFEGLCDLRLERFQDAIAVFEPLLPMLQQPAAIAQAAFYYGESLCGLGRMEDAIGAYQQATAASETSLWGRLSQFGLGWAYYRLSRCEESLSVFDKYLAQRKPDHRTEALFAEGSCLIQLGRKDEATAKFQQVLATDPQHPLAVEGGLALIDTYRRDGKLGEAKELVHALLRGTLDEKARGQLQLRLGGLVLEEGNVAQAKTLFDLARQNRELSIQQGALSGLGDVQMFLGDLAGAKRLYGEAIQLSERTAVSAYAGYQLAKISLQNGETDQAVAGFRRLLEHPDASYADEARLGLAIAYLNQRNVQAARGELDELRRRQPRSAVSARALYYEALLALDEGQEASAQRLCQEVMARSAGSDEAFEARLLLLDLQGHEAGASRMVDALRQLYATQSLPRHQQARLALRIGDAARAEEAFAQAIHWYQAADALFPSIGGEVAYRIASCYEEGADVPLAIQWYQQIHQPAWRVRGQLAAAKLLEREDRVKEAEAIYRQLSREPIPEAKIVQERLNALRGVGSGEEFRR